MKNPIRKFVKPLQQLFPIIIHTGQKEKTEEGPIRFGLEVRMPPSLQRISKQFRNLISSYEVMESRFGKPSLRELFLVVVSSTESRFQTLTSSLLWIALRSRISTLLLNALRGRSTGSRGPTAAS